MHKHSTLLSLEGLSSSGRRRRGFLLALMLVSCVVDGPRTLIANEPLSQSPLSSSPDFDTEIIPILTRQGCNSGACHGAAIGRGGFKLSLFGSAPDQDHLSIARELEGRRLNLAKVDSSLLLLKATESIEHGGGERFDSESRSYQILMDWIRSGATREGQRRLVSLDIQPQSKLVEQVGTPVSVSVQARFSDGTERDVTEWTVLASDDDDSVEIDLDDSEITPRRAGEQIVVARYLDRVIPIRISVPLGKQDAEVPSLKNAAMPEPQNHDLIDAFINQKLIQLRVPASGPADDHEFARRVWLDLAGRLPTIAELEQYVSDTGDDKQSRLVDRLLNSDEFSTYWSYKWAGVLSIDSRQLQPEGAEAFHHWLTEQFRSDASWRSSTQSMLTSSGDGFVNGPVNFLRSANGPDGLAESATEVFLGVRMRCANCHDHPLDRWKQDDYHGLAAIFAKLNRGRIVGDTNRGEVTHPVTGLPAVARLPGTRNLLPDENWRQAFADWVTADDNQFFARAAVNRIWSQLMGRGLIDPVDDLRATNPASHPELLQRLSEAFIENDYRFKPVIRMICTSHAYQRTSQALSTNQSDETFYSHFLRRRLEAEVIANAIGDVTGVSILHGVQDSSKPDRRRMSSTRAQQSVSTEDALRLTDNRTPSLTLDILGRCDRSQSCETAPSGAGSLAQVLHFLNGDLLNHRLASPSGNLSRWSKEQPSDEKLIETLYLATLSRPLRPAERRYWMNELASIRPDGDDAPDAEKRKNFFVDVLWALITSETFLSNQ